MNSSHLSLAKMSSIFSKFWIKTFHKIQNSLLGAGRWPIKLKTSCFPEISTPSVVRTVGTGDWKRDFLFVVFFQNLFTVKILWSLDQDLSKCVAIEQAGNSFSWIFSRRNSKLSSPRSTVLKEAEEASNKNNSSNITWLELS